MLDEQQRLLENFGQRVSQLLNLCTLLRGRNAQLEKQLKEAEASFSHAVSELELLRKQYLNLKVAKQLTGDEDALDATRQRLGKLVREVDKCIEMLKD